MAHQFGWLRPLLILLMGIGYQGLVQSALEGGQTQVIRIALALIPLVALACWVVTRARNKLRWSLILLAAAIAIYVLEHQQRWGLAVAYGIPHTVIYLFLLWLFGQTLRYGKEPLVTRLARRVHGTLSPELTAYTYRVTFAWCVFFTAQLIISGLLFRFAPLNMWSLFINVLSFPLLVLMFVGEYCYRVFRHRLFPHASFFDGIRAFSNEATRSSSTKQTSPRA